MTEDEKYVLYRTRFHKIMLWTVCIMMTIMLPLFFWSIHDLSIQKKIWEKGCREQGGEVHPHWTCLKPNSEITVKMPEDK